MIERKCWAESQRVEHSAQKIWGETSNSFRRGDLRRLLMPSFVLLISFKGINKIQHVTAKCELFGGSFQVLGADVFLRFGLRPLQCRRDQLHQMVHEHAPTILWIEYGEREPGVDASGPLLQVQFAKGWPINALQGQQDTAHFCFRVTGNAAIGVHAIQASSELHPHRLWLIKDILERDAGPAPCSD